jgi:hypothetical protein
VLPILSEARKLAIAALLIVLIVGTVSAGSKAFLEDAEDGDLYDGSPVNWDAADCGGSSPTATQNGFINGSYEVSLNGCGGGGSFTGATGQVLTNPEIKFNFRINKFTSDLDIYFSAWDSGDVDNLGNSRSVIVREDGGDLTALEDSSSSNTLTVLSNLQADKVYRVSLRNFDFSGETYDIYVNGNLEASGVDFWNSASDIEAVSPAGGSTDAYYDNIYVCSGGSCPSLNDDPSIDSVSYDPMSWSIGSSINVSANASDSDGSVQSVTADVWENGTQIVSDASLTNNSGTWEATDLFTVDESDVYYNLTLTATDDDGATATYSDSQLIKDKPPKFSIKDLENKTYLRYENNWTLEVEKDGDNVPGEEISCSIYDDGNLTQSFNLTEGSNDTTDSGSVAHDVGSYDFTASCSDPAGNTKNHSRSYNISRFQILNLSTVGPVYETENVSYSLKVKAGSMVEDMESEFLYNGTERTTRNHSNSAGEVHTYEFTHYFRPPLVSTNQTDFSWSFNATGTYQTFNNSSLKEQTKLEQGGNQTVWQAYHSPEISVPRDKLIEKEDFSADLSFTNELNLEVAEIDGYLSFNGSEKQSRSTSFDYPLVGEGSQSSTKTVSGRIDLSFRNKSLSRSSISDDSLTGHKKIITDCSSGSASQTAFHEYVVYNEENRTEKLDADIDYNYDVTHHGEHERNYAFGRSGKSVETCIYPSWAEYRITGPMQYNAQDFTPRAYEFFNATINNETETTNLYLLPESDSTAVYYRVEEADGSGVAQATVKTMRYFVDQNSYLTISKVETDNNGEAQTYQKINDIYYKYMITKDGKVLKETENQILTCSSNPCTKVFTVDPNTVSEYFTQKKAFSYNCRVNEDDPSLQCTVNHESGSMEKATLKVDEHQRIGEETICDIETVQTGSSMVCQLNNLSEYSYSYELKGYKDGEQYLLTYGSIDRTEGIMGNDANSLFFSMFLVLTAAGIGRYSPGAAILWTSIGLSAASLTILTIPLTALTGIIAVGVIGLLEVRS